MELQRQSLRHGSVRQDLHCKAIGVEAHVTRNFAGQCSNIGEQGLSSEPGSSKMGRGGLRLIDEGGRLSKTRYRGLACVDGQLTVAACGLRSDSPAELIEGCLMTAVVP